MEVTIPNRQQQINQIVHRLMSHEDHLSYSSLSCFKTHPMKFIDYKLGIKEETEAMQYGSMLHCLVLEPTDFKNRYYAINDTETCEQIGGSRPRSTNRYKDWYKGELEKAEGKTIVDTNDYLAASIAAENIKNNRAASKIVYQAEEREKAIEWEYKNFVFHGFKDGDGPKIIFDLKTCQDATPAKFQKEIASRGYYLQAAMYMYEGGEVKDYYIIAIDRKNGVSVHKLEQALIEHGMNEYSDLMDKFNHCIFNEAFDQSFDFHSPRLDGIFVCEKPTWLY